MATMATTRGVVNREGAAHELTCAVALRYAWWCWLGLLLVPFVYFLVVMWTLANREDPVMNHQLANYWFVGTMAYLALAVPLAIFWRSHAFRAYWHGEVVSPRDYLVGMVSVWVAIEIGGLLSLTGCLVSNTLLPCLLPGAVAFMLFTPLWPSGRAMVRRQTGNTDDPERYEEPR